MPTVRINYYGMEGQGRTLTEAKTDAGRQIEKALTGFYTPEVLVWRGHAILVYRRPEGWHACLIADADTGIRAGPVWGWGAEDTKEEAIRDALEHLADLGWQPEDGLTPPPFLKERRSIADFQTKVRFWQRCQKGKERGLEGNDLHAYAARDPRRAELWQHEEEEPCSNS